MAHHEGLSYFNEIALRVCVGSWSENEMLCTIFLLILRKYPLLAKAAKCCFFHGMICLVQQSADISDAQLLLFAENVRQSRGQAKTSLTESKTYFIGEVLENTMRRQRPICL
jgi:hypothetical protein